jgi:hypothetical protein
MRVAEPGVDARTKKENFGPFARFSRLDIERML